MSLYLCGVDYHTCPLELRSRLSFTHTQQENLLRRFRLICRCVIVSTCNRTEFYWFDDAQEPISLRQMAAELCSFKGADFAELSPYLYYKEGREAVMHLFAVTAGLESLAFGEDQILGQIKNAHLLALRENACSGLLDKVFSAAQAAAKLVKKQTSISDISTNIGTIAADIVKKSIGLEQGILLIGTGETGIITLKNLRAAGFKNIYATNRTRGRLENASQLYHDIKTIAYAERYRLIPSVGCIISCTASPHYTVTCQGLQERSRVKPLTVIDLAVPRDVERAVTEMPNVTLWDMDRIAEIISRNKGKKHEAGKQAQFLIEQACAKFIKETERRRFDSVIQKLEQEKSAIIQKQMKKLPQGPATQAQIQAALTSAMNEFSGKVIYPVKESAESQEAAVFFRLIDDALRRNSGS